MASGLYREKSIQRISSPEQLNDYLKVTKPAVWAVLLSIVLILVGFIVWGALTYISSSVKGMGEVKDGVMTIRFEDGTFAENVQPGMSVSIGDATATVTSTGYDGNGNVFAQAETKLEDGNYEVTVNYKKTQILNLLLGD